MYTGLQAKIDLAAKDKQLAEGRKLSATEKQKELENLSELQLKMSNLEDDMEKKNAEVERVKATFEVRIEELEEDRELVKRRLMEVFNQKIRKKQQHVVLVCERAFFFFCILLLCMCIIYRLKAFFRKRRNLIMRRS